jgi:predicted transcriptional regulator
VFALAALCYSFRRNKEEFSMSQTITISLPDDTKDALDNAATEEGLSESALVEKAVSDYLFIRRFRSLRERMMSQGKNLTDQDVFDLVPGH